MVGVYELPVSVNETYIRSLEVREAWAQQAAAADTGRVRGMVREMRKPTPSAFALLHGLNQRIDWATIPDLPFEEQNRTPLLFGTLLSPDVSRLRLDDFVNTLPPEVARQGMEEAAKIVAAIEDSGQRDEDVGYILSMRGSLTAG